MPVDPELELDFAAADDRRFRLERELLACTCADLYLMLPAVDALGVMNTTFSDRAHAAIWLALLWSFNSGRITGDREADNLAAAPWVRRALEVVECWSDDEKTYTKNSSVWTPQKVVDQLFHGSFPSRPLAEASARNLLRIDRQIREAGQVLAERTEEVRKILAGDGITPRKVTVFNSEAA